MSEAPRTTGLVLSYCAGRTPATSRVELNGLDITQWVAGLSTSLELGQPTTATLTLRGLMIETIAQTHAEGANGGASKP